MRPRPTADRGAAFYVRGLAGMASEVDVALAILSDDRVEAT
jgi:hypothetical protein